MAKDGRIVSRSNTASSASQQCGWWIDRVVCALPRLATTWQARSNSSWRKRRESVKFKKANLVKNDILAKPALSSTGRLISRGEERVVGLRTVWMEFPLAGCSQLFPQSRWIGFEFLLLHPAQEGLTRNLAGIRVTFGELPFDEFLDRFRHRDFHVLNLHKLLAKTTPKALRGLKTQSANLKC